MRKRPKTDEHDNADRWVVSYADFITLLFAFFATMYAISHVDAGKLEKFTGSMRSAFKSADQSASVSLIEGINPVNYSDLQVEKEIRTMLGESGIINSVKIMRDERGVLLSIGDSVVFDTGSAALKNEADALLSAVAALMRKTDNNIIIEGHTDNVPISNSKYSSNWELSTARATSVLMYFMKEQNIHPSRFAAAGYGEYKPVASNTNPEGRTSNRRVDIIFKSKSNG